MSGHDLLAVEWGTARMVARWLDRDGAVVARQERGGVAGRQRQEIVDEVESLAAEWPAAARGGMVLAGMIGSAMGWHEVARIPCPADAPAIAAAAWHGAIGDRPVTILPGLSCTSRFAEPDVLRGEEVTAIGLVAAQNGAPCTLVSVPGMHGKWLRLSTNVEDFHTAMTIELRHAVATSTVLAPLMIATAEDGDAFRRGVRLGASAGLARALFAGRARQQAGRMGADEASSFLSGVLIGADVADGAVAGVDHVVTGEPAAVALYVAAFDTLGCRARAGNTERLAANGFCTINTLLDRVRVGA